MSNCAAPTIGPRWSRWRRSSGAKRVADGHFVKFVGSTEVDANLLGLATPFGVVEPDDPAMVATVRRIEADLQRGGGLHRYRADSYYGGGEWILLTAWLGWYYARRGERDKAEAALRWIEAQADADGQLPEQVPLNLNDPAHYAPWRERWGDDCPPAALVARQVRDPAQGGARLAWWAAGPSSQTSGCSNPGEDIWMSGASTLRSIAVSKVPRCSPNSLSVRQL